jgi:hypothetical protein
MNSSSPFFRNVLGLPPVEVDFDRSNWIESIELIDVEYLPAEHYVFSQNYSEQANVRLGPEDNAPVINYTQFNPDCLGRQKTDAWDIEKESRILCCLYRQDFDKWPFIDLRLKEELFRDLTIILNPWADDHFETEVKNLISACNLSKEIKSSIVIQHSSERGRIKL